MKRKIISFSIICIMALFLIQIPINCPAVPVTNLNWWPLPPYNTLWPLWSPILSPVSALGIPTPIVNSLTADTVLPVQPGLTWDPNKKYPWLLYNTPLGMVYYDPLYGIDLWPPNYLLSIFGTPVPINLALIPGWSTLAPTSTAWLQTNVPIGNNAYYSSYPIYAPLLTPASVLGLPPL